MLYEHEMKFNRIDLGTEYNIIRKYVISYRRHGSSNSSYYYTRTPLIL